MKYVLFYSPLVFGLAQILSQNEGGIPQYTQLLSCTNAKVCMAFITLPPSMIAIAYCVVCCNCHIWFYISMFMAQFKYSLQKHTTITHTTHTRTLEHTVLVQWVSHRVQQQWWCMRQWVMWWGPALLVHTPLRMWLMQSLTHPPPHPTLPMDTSHKTRSESKTQ